MESKKMYNIVFQDMIKCYLEGMHEDDKIALTNEEIKELSNKLYNDTYLWRCINETIDFYLGKLINEKEGAQNE